MPEAAPGTYKGQPWILFDSIAALSFLLGDQTNGVAFGSRIPAINAAGDMIFLSAGRTRAAVPWYTNLDQDGQLSFGMEIYQVALMLSFPLQTPNQNTGFDVEVNPGVAPGLKLAECLMQYGILELDLGQEEQMAFPCSCFGAGGGIVVNNSAAVAAVQNSLQQNANVLKLPEPIECPRTQNINAKLRIPPEVQAMIGTPAAPGVGAPLDPYILGLDAETEVELQQPPYLVQLRLYGRRIKKTQYGQIPSGSVGA